MVVTPEVGRCSCVALSTGERRIWKKSGPTVHGLFVSSCFCAGSWQPTGKWHQADRGGSVQSGVPDPRPRGQMDQWWVVLTSLATCWEELKQTAVLFPRQSKHLAVKTAAVDSLTQPAAPLYDHKTCHCCYCSWVIQLSSDEAVIPPSTCGTAFLL